MTDTHEFSLVFHCFSWNAPSSDTKNTKRTSWKKDNQMRYYQAAEIVQISILHLYDMFLNH